MIIKRIIFLLFLIFSTNIYGQELSKKIEYSFHINLQNYEEGYSYKSVLYFNDNESLFIYNSTDLEKKVGFRKFIKSRSKDIQGVSLFRNFDEKGNIVYWNNETNKMISRDFLGGSYAVQVNEETPNFNWKIVDSVKTINGYNCYKALSENFRGRSYTAWFTYEIPVPFGPYKFNGLPGLILEIYDDLKLVHITAGEDELVLKNDENYKISAPSETQSMSPLEYMEIKFQWYLNKIEETKNLDTGRKITPLPYSAIEYTEEQQYLLNEIQTIEQTEDDQ